MNDFLTEHPNVRSGIRVSVYTFLAVFLPAVLGFLGEVNEWMNDTNGEFPSVSVLTKAAVAGVSAVISGLIAFTYNKIPVGKSAEYRSSGDQR